MNPMPDMDASRPAAGGRLRLAAESLILWLHRKADRWDLIPSEFGEEAPVDQSDAGAVAREWLRQLRLWAAYNPEEVLALKAGVAILGAALLGLVILVGAVR